MTLSSLTAWLLTFGKTFLSWVYNVGIDFLNALISAVCTAAVSVISLFPAGNPVPVPLASPAASPTLAAFINALNWFFPIGYFVTVVTFVTAAMASYFIIAPVARWFKLLT